MDLPTPAIADLAAQGLSDRSVRMPTGTRDLEVARKAAEEFEAMFLSQMLSHTWAGVGTDGPFGGGQAEEIYRSLLVEQYGKLIAQRGGVGIADAVQRQLLQTQEV